MPVSGGAAGLHRRQTAHTAILFVELAVDLHDLPGGLRTAGEQSATDDAMREGERLDDIPALGDAAIGKQSHALLLRHLGADIESRELGNPTPATIRVVQILPGPCPILIIFAPQLLRYSTPSPLVTFPAMIGRSGNSSRISRTVSPTPFEKP